MGQFLSSPQPEPPPWLTPVENVDQFIERFRSWFQNHLEKQQRDWFELLFTKFGSESESSPNAWSESDVVKILSITLPDELKPALTATGPVLFRCMTRLGSFPYHNLPTSNLTVDVALIALIILVRCNEEHGSAIADISYGDYGSEEKMAEWLRRILFQCMAIRAEPGEESNNPVDGEPERDPSDDEHLLSAHKFVVDGNTWRDWNGSPKLVHHGPPIIPAHRLPSSRSQDFSGHIPRNEFDPLIKLLLVNQLYSYDGGAEVLTRDSKQLDACVASILNAFPRPDEEPNLTWDSYNRILSSHLPYIFSGFTGLLAPLLANYGDSPEHSETLTKEEAMVLLRQPPPDPKFENIPTASILNPHILAQLLTFLPEARLGNPSALFSTPDGKFTLDVLRSRVPRRQPLGLLITGVASGPEKSSDRAPICFGAFLPEEGEDREDTYINEDLEQIPASVFKLRPTHWVSRSPASGVTVREDGNDRRMEIYFAGAGYGTAKLVLDEEARTVSYCPQTQNDRSGGNDSFRVSVVSLDLIGFPPAREVKFL